MKSLGIYPLNGEFPNEKISLIIKKSVFNLQILSKFTVKKNKITKKCFANFTHYIDKLENGLN